MASILKAIKKQRIPVVPAVVISNRPDAAGLKTAQKLGVAVEVVPSKGFEGSRAKYDAQVARILKKHGVTPTNGLVCLAGFMRIMGPGFVKKYKNRILNIHPALLPAFGGLDSQRRALEYGVRYSGCTVHFVDAGTDTGPIILQDVVKIRKDDTEQTLSRRILRREHRIYPEAVRLFATKRIKVVRRRVIIT